MDQFAATITPKPAQHGGRRRRRPPAALGQGRRGGVARAGRLGRGQAARPVRHGGRRGDCRGGGRQGVGIGAVAIDLHVADRDLAQARLHDRRGQGAADDVVPAAPVEAVLDGHAADDQPVAGAGQGDIEQAQALVPGRVLAPRPRRRRRRAVVGLARRPQETAALGVEQRPAQGQGAAGGVGQEDHRRLQTLGAVGGHHPHLALAVLLLAFDVDLGRGHVGDEGLQGVDAPRLGRQGLGQEGVEGVLGLGAQPGENAGAHRAAVPVQPGQHAGVEVERRAGLGLGLGPAQEGAGVGPAFALVAAPGQGRPDRALARLDEVVEVLLGNVAERAAQQSGQGQIVLGEQGELGEADQVLEHHVVRQLQPVGPAHRRALALQRPDDLVEQGLAPAHQDQEVAVARRPPGPRLLVEHRLAPIDGRLDLAGDAPGQLLVRPFGRLGVDRRPRIGVVLGLGPLQRPQVDRPAARRPVGDMDHRLLGGQGVRAQAGAGLGIGEHGVDEGQHLRRRAPALQQVDAAEGPPGRLDQALIGARLGQEPLRRGPLERVDRLLLVADGEDRPRARVGPGAGEELTRQHLQDVPLVGGGVLGLVQQHMVNAAVQLVEHPGGVGAHGQEVVGAGDEVAEVQPPLGRLGGVVEAGVGAGQGQGVDAVTGDPGGLGPLDGLDQPGLLPDQPFAGGGIDPAGAQPRLGLAGLGAEHRPDRREVRIGGGGPHLRRQRLVGRRRAASQGLGGARPGRPVDAGGGLGLDGFRLDRFGKAAAGPDVLGRAAFAGVDIGLDRQPPRLEGGEHVVEAAVVQLDREVGVGPAQRPVAVRQGEAGQVVAGPGRDLGRRCVLQHAEARRDAGLQRKAPQQLFAEGVDGLDLQPARRLQGAGEQGPGPRQVARLLVDLLQRLDQRLVGHHRPAAEVLIEPALHLGGGGLGVGDAEDRLGRGPAQQQAGHAADQGRGLARAGVGGDRDRAVGVRGEDLRVEGGPDHSPPSPASPSPMTCHSHRRARWS